MLKAKSSRGGAIALLMTSVFMGASCADNANFKANTRTDLNQSADAQGTSFSGDPIASTPGTLPRAISRKPDSLVSVFPAAEIKQDSFRFTLDPKGVQTDFILTDIQQLMIENKDQLTRTPATETYKQGTSGTAVNEMIAQTAKKGLVDILVVVDNSGSMKEEQANLGTKLNELLVSLGTTQWQIGVISTSAIPDGAGFRCAMNLIRSTDADAMTRFQSAVNLGISGDSNERGILQAVVGLGCNTAPWLRANSTVAVLIVSDEDNCSKDGLDCNNGNDPWAKESYLINYVEGSLKRTIGVNAGFYGIFSPPSTPCTSAQNLGTQYQRLVDYKANGMKNYGNICDASYKSTLNRISDNIALLVANQFDLKDLPSPGTLRLKLKLADGSEQALAAGDYTLQGKTISFQAGKEPPIGSTILASYRVGASPLFSSVSLGNDPAPGSLAVAINGNPLAAGAFTLVGRTLSFTTQPQELADIRIDYRMNTALIDRFKLQQIPASNTLSVSVNGTPSSGFSFDAAQNQVLLNPVPADGSRIAISYKYRVGPQLSYTLPIMAGGKNFQILDGLKALNFQQNVDVFTLNAADHSAGKILKLKYEVPDGMPRNFTLSHTPLAGSIKVQSTADCSLGKGLDVQGNILVTSCPVLSSQSFILDFSYAEIRRSFELTGIAEPDKGQWTVLVNGTATLDYKRVGSTITLNFDPELDAKVVLNYSFPEP